MRSNVEKFNHYQKLFFWGAFLLLVVSVCSYVYFLNGTIRNVVERQKAETRIASIRGAVGELESRYIVLKDSITLDLASSLGFQTVQNPVFISRTALSKALSVNSVE
ncbi:MAG: hypothetical protein PHS53_01065 [Candidatus Pacebacteria bacterium]|nr:hypothetical protein [Candidatus Paceibacterota bacterium]MDD5356723.1 hypothetical protein [Candidatus Paceibacterota bacterium]